LGQGEYNLILRYNPMMSFREPRSINTDRCHHILIPVGREEAGGHLPVGKSKKQMPAVGLLHGLASSDVAVPA
jgi:hypothetical protein